MFGAIAVSGVGFASVPASGSASGDAPEGAASVGWTGSPPPFFCASGEVAGGSSTGRPGAGFGVANIA
ncbi:hypothetical protein [Roseovarius sp. TE539]|uniref:hypothetical protein n=1 Tax=Roseovarius sp. TE539 TaxID=2249812 RepID=UPI0011BD4B25|nr:hypothetical protein [Roseovarius sp. TE539]